MTFKLKPTRKKVDAVYKTIYLPREVLERVDAIAKSNDTSFNNVVVSMIESCLEEQDSVEN